MGFRWVSVNVRFVTSALIIVVMILGVVAIAAPRVSNRGEAFCKLALPIYDFDGVSYTARDITGDGPDSCDYDPGVARIVSPVVGYDCGVTYPQNWTGRRFDKIDPSIVGGNCGTTAGPHRSSDIVGATMLALSAVAAAVVGWGRRPASPGPPTRTSSRRHRELVAAATRSRTPPIAGSVAGRDGPLDSDRRTLGSCETRRCHGRK